MMFFFDTVQIFSTSGKTAKGRALQEMALRFQDVLVQADDAPVKIMLEMRSQAAEIDKQYNRGRQTYVDIVTDRNDHSGQITAYPVSDVVDFDKHPYFKIYFHKVARTANMLEAYALVKGGEK